MNTQLLNKVNAIIGILAVEQSANIDKLERANNLTNVELNAVSAVSKCADGNSGAESVRALPQVARKDVKKVARQLSKLSKLADDIRSGAVIKEYAPKDAEYTIRIFTGKADESAVNLTAGEYRSFRSVCGSRDAEDSRRLDNDTLETVYQAFDMLPDVFTDVVKAQWPNFRIHRKSNTNAVTGIVRPSETFDFIAVSVGGEFETYRIETPAAQNSKSAKETAQAFRDALTGIESKLTANATV